MKILLMFLFTPKAGRTNLHSALFSLSHSIKDNEEAITGKSRLFQKENLKPFHIRFETNLFLLNISKIPFNFLKQA